jgi:TonB family protein
MNITWSLIVVGALASSLASAQTGPLRTRVVVAGIRGPFPKQDTHMDLSVVVEIAVDADGRVTNRTIVESSGNETFDQKVLKYYSKFRFVPQLEENGAAVASTVRMRFRRAGIGSPPAAPPLQSDEPRVFDEVARIGRMKCSDFLWEYDLLKEIAGRQRSVNQETMLTTSLAMFVVQEKMNDSELKLLNRSFDKIVRESVESCRQNPQEKYWSGVLAPALKAAVPR